MIQFLLPLLGSMGGSALASSLGGGLLTKALMMGGGSFLGSKLGGADTEDALMSGLLSAATGGLSGLMGQGADAAVKGAKAIGATGATGANAASGLSSAPLGMGPIEMTSFKMAGGAGGLPAAGAAALSTGSAPSRDIAALAAQGAQGAQSGLTMRGALDWAQRNPGLALTGAGLLASALPNPAPIQTGSGEQKDIPENFPNRPGPQRGYGRPNMTEEQYLNYGVAGGPSASEFAFFDRPQTTGGLVSGGPPGTDTVPGVNVSTGAPYLLDNGEYVLPREMTRAIGIPALERMRRMYV